jgi:cytochrome c oxidase subunit 4
MSDNSSSNHHGDHGHDEPHIHIMPLKTYYLIFAWLGVLTAFTVIAAFIDWPRIGGFSLNFPIAMAIATTKATLVVMFFMHVKYSSNLVKLCVATSLAFFLVLMVGALMDYYTRAGVEIAFYQPKL